MIPNCTGMATCRFILYKVCFVVDQKAKMSSDVGDCHGRDRIYGSWIYNYMCKQWLSTLTLWVRIPIRRGVLDTTLCDKVCQWLAAGRGFLPNKTDRHDITERLLKVALNTITLTPVFWYWHTIGIILEGYVQTVMSNGVGKEVLKFENHAFCLYSQTCQCGHLYQKVTFLLSCRRKCQMKWPFLRGHLSYAVTFSLSQRWPLNTGLTVYCTVERRQLTTPEHRNWI